MSQDERLVVCQTCGDSGFQDLLVFCSGCWICAEHRYCMHQIPKNDELEIYWLCANCKLDSTEIDSDDTLSFNSGENNYNQECQNQQVNCAEGSPRKSRYLLTHSCDETVSSLEQQNYSNKIEVMTATKSDSFNSENNHNMKCQNQQVICAEGSPSKTHYYLTQSGDGTGSHSEQQNDFSCELEIIVTTESVVSKDKSCSPNILEAIRTASSSLEKELENDNEKPSRRTRGILVLAEEEPSYEVANSDDFYQGTLKRNIVQPGAPLVESPSLNYAEDASNGAHEVQIGSSGLSSEKIKMPAGNSDMMEKEVDNHLPTQCSKDNFLGRKRSRFTLSDENHSDEKTKSDNFASKKSNIFDQVVLKRVPMHLNEQFAESLPLGCAEDSSNGMHDACKNYTGLSDTQGAVHVEACDIQLKTSFIPNMMESTNTSGSSVPVEEEVEKGIHPHKQYSEKMSYGRKRRKIILAGNNQLDGEEQAYHLDQNVLESRTEQQNRESPPFDCAEDSSGGAYELLIHSTGVSNTQEKVNVETRDIQLNMSCHQACTEQALDSPAWPSCHTWRGCFDICNKDYGPLTARLSSRACDRVCRLAGLLPPVLHMEKLPRLEAWPNSFRRSPPIDDNIALYFFPCDGRAESILDQLLNDVINNDLVLKVILEEAELLVFPSVILPEDNHRIDGKYYPWGVFKARQISEPSVPPKLKSIEGVENDVEVEARNAKRLDNFCSTNSDDSLPQSIKLFDSEIPVSSLSEECPSELTEVAEAEQSVKVDKHVKVGAEASEASFPQPLKIFGWQVPILSASERLLEKCEHPEGQKEEVQSLDGPREHEEGEVLVDSEHPGEKKEVESHDGPKDLDGEGEIVEKSEHPEGKKEFQCRDGCRDLSQKEDACKETEEIESFHQLFGASETEEAGTCMELFPLKIEDMAISGRTCSSGDLDLKLRISCQ